MTIDEIETTRKLAARLIKESEHWGKWEVRVEGSPEEPWLRAISIVHSHDGDDFPVLHLDCSAEEFAPELADRIVSLNNDLPALLSALLQVNTWQLRPTAQATKTKTVTDTLVSELAKKATKG